MRRALVTAAPADERVGAGQAMTARWSFADQTMTVADATAEEIDLSRRTEFRLGGLVVRPSAREVQGDGTAERLEPRVMQALVALADRAGAAVSRETLVALCWGGRIVGDDAINGCMAKLRRVGGTHGAFSIEAIPRVGYRLIPTNAPAAEPASFRRRWPWALGGAALAVAAGLGAWLTVRPTLSEATPYVVIPFTTTSNEPALKAFATAAGSESASAIAQYRLPRAAGFGDRIEVRGLVDGDTGHIRARISLVDVSSGATLWTREFSGAAAEAGTLRDQIAWRVAAVSDMSHHLLHYRSRDFDAESLGLSARGIDGVETNSWAPLVQAEALVRRSPGYGPGHSQLGGALIAAAALGPPEQAPALRTRALAETRRALAISPNYYLSQQNLAWLIAGDRWSEKLRLLDVGEPKADSIWQSDFHVGLLLITAGRVAAGRFLLAQALNGHEHESSQMMEPLVYAAHLSGLDEQARSLARAGHRLRPEDQISRRMLLDMTALTGDPEEALAIVADPTEHRADLSGDVLEAYRAFLGWRKSDAERDRRVATTAILGVVASGRLYPAEAVPMLAKMGQLDAAFGVAQGYAEDPRTLMSGMLFRPEFLFFPETAPMRRDPRFIRLAETLGLVRFWQETGVWPDFCRSEPQSICRRMQRADGTAPSRPLT